MNILLTGDWHLKPKHPYTKIVEDKVWDELCALKLKALNLIPHIAKVEECEIVAIAGDVFDTSNPPEALKAEFAKILNKFNPFTSVHVITGREGEHDYINENNYVLMDLKEAFKAKDNIHIYDRPYCSIDSHIGVFHLMLKGVSPLYDKHSVELFDERFAQFETILLADYHGKYHKKFGDKTFIYGGCPYPTRYGEIGCGVAIITVDRHGKCNKIRRVGFETFNLVEVFNIDDIQEDMEQPEKFVLKVVLNNVAPKEMNNVLSILNKWKNNLPKDCLDLIWEMKTEKDNKEKVIGKAGLRDTCLEYIDKRSDYPKTSKKIFTKVESEC